LVSKVFRSRSKAAARESLRAPLFDAFARDYAAAFREE
jgi:hypothetical protein